MLPIGNVLAEETNSFGTYYYRVTNVDQNDVLNLRAEPTANSDIVGSLAWNERLVTVTKLNNDGKVIFGSTVFLENLDTGEKINYKIVGRDEADLKQKLIYFQSPIGKGLIGKNKKDLVEINTPAGTKNFEIIDVKYV